MLFNNCLPYLCLAYLCLPLLTLPFLTFVYLLIKIIIISVSGSLSTHHARHVLSSLLIFYCNLIMLLFIIENNAIEDGDILGLQRSKTGTTPPTRDKHKPFFKKASLHLPFIYPSTLLAYCWPPFVVNYTHHRVLYALCLPYLCLTYLCLHLLTLTLLTLPLFTLVSLCLPYLSLPLLTLPLLNLSLFTFVYLCLPYPWLPLHTLSLITFVYVTFIASAYLTFDDLCV